MTQHPGWPVPTPPVTPPPASIAGTPPSPQPTWSFAPPPAPTAAPPPPGAGAPPAAPSPAWTAAPQAPPPGTSATQPGPFGTTTPAPNPLGTYTPVPAVDRPIGYTMSTPSRPARRAHLGGAAGAVLAVAYLVLKLFLIGHVASSVVGGSGGSPQSTQLSELRGAAAVLTAGFAGATPEVQASMLHTFDDALRNIPLSGQADTDRTSALAADEAFESALTGGGNVPAAQATHIAAVNQLAHDLGGGDVLSLTTST